jgi:hypothetical protein
MQTRSIRGSGEPVLRHCTQKVLAKAVPSHMTQSGHLRASLAAIRPGFRLAACDDLLIRPDGITASKSIG